MNLLANLLGAIVLRPTLVVLAIHARIILAAETDRTALILRNAHPVAVARHLRALHPLAQRDTPVAGARHARLLIPLIAVFVDAAIMFAGRSASQSGGVRGNLDAVEHVAASAGPVQTGTLEDDHLSFRAVNRAAHGGSASASKWVPTDMAHTL